MGQKSKSKGDQANKWKNGKLKQERKKEKLKCKGDKEIEEIIKSKDRGWAKRRQKILKATETNETRNKF